MKIYIAHSFGPEHESAHRLLKSDQEWRRFVSRLAIRGIRIVDPADVPVPPTDPQGRFDYCLSEIASSDAIVVDASGNLGIGVGAEMMFANSKSIEVLVVCPINSHYRRRRINGDVTLHPFLHALSTKIFIDIDSCADDLLTKFTRRRNA